ncbi:Hypothetical protein BIBO2_1428 [Brucella sp. BO2]|nr:Hypothetical protein BIBO2_1428 [Brucella sp. BO2]
MIGAELKPKETIWLSTFGLLSNQKAVSFVNLEAADGEKPCALLIFGAPVSYNR